MIAASVAALLAIVSEPYGRITRKTPAITTFGRGNHSIRSERWRYIRYADGPSRATSPNATKCSGSDAFQKAARRVEEFPTCALQNSDAPRIKLKVMCQVYYDLNIHPPIG